MPKEEPVDRSVPGSGAYHDAHGNDPDEWDEAGSEVDVQPTGMTAFSLRLPANELSNLKAEADARSTSVSQLVRAAIRAYMARRASGALSYGEVYGMRLTSAMPDWKGGGSAPSQVDGAPATPVVIEPKRS
jgi:hypothetical protein